MATAVSLRDIDPARIKINQGGPNKPSSSVYPFFVVTENGRTTPSVFLVRYQKGTWSSAHFHTVDQFNVVVEGKGMFGRHEIGPYHVHFSNAYTAYGPLEPDKEEGWAFLTVRTRYDPGAQRLPEGQEKLKSVPGRRPWQVTRKVHFTADTSTDLVPHLAPIADLCDERGLYTAALDLPADGTVVLPDPSSGDGQYVIVLEGSVVLDHREHHALTAVHIDSAEPAFNVRAGPNGLKGLVLNFPRVAPAGGVALSAGHRTHAQRWQCPLCAFSYDESRGLPDDDIAPGTPWEKLPQDWTCPDCGAAKADFEKLQALSN